MVVFQTITNHVGDTHFCGRIRRSYCGGSNCHNSQIKPSHNDIFLVVNWWKNMNFPIFPMNLNVLQVQFLVQQIYLGLLTIMPSNYLKSLTTHSLFLFLRHKPLKSRILTSFIVKLIKHLNWLMTTLCSHESRLENSNPELFYSIINQEMQRRL